MFVHCSFTLGSLGIPWALGASRIPWSVFGQKIFFFQLCGLKDWQAMATHGDPVRSWSVGHQKRPPWVGQFGAYHSIAGGVVAPPCDRSVSCQQPTRCHGDGRIPVPGGNQVVKDANKIYQISAWEALCGYRYSVSHSCLHVSGLWFVSLVVSLLFFLLSPYILPWLYLSPHYLVGWRPASSGLVALACCGLFFLST